MNNKSIKNYEQAKAFLGGKKERPYAHNTRIEIDSLNLGHEVITVKYHGNPVVEMFPNGTNTYNSCGWRTLTTKERINWFLPDGFSLYQERSVWYVVKHGTSYKFGFADGLTIDANGNVYNDAPADESAEVKKTIKAIKKYVDGYIKALLNGEVGKPDGGDCWDCYMHTEDGESLGDKVKSSGRIESHFEESYYVPSMLTNAYNHNKRLCDLTRDGIARIWQGEEISTWQKSIIERDVKSSLTAYLKHALNIAQ